jgi:CDP-diacylglycerol pyrophosphatase
MTWKQSGRTPQARRRVFAVLAGLLTLSLLPMPLFANMGGCDNDTVAGPRHQLKHTCPAGSNPDILLKIAEGCAQNLKANKSCRARSPRRDYVILKDISPCKPKGYLLIPSQCVTGVEDKQVLAEPVVDFWWASWIWSRRELPDVPPSRIAIAVNSLGARGNDQLHFHLSCVSRKVRRTLQQNKASIPRFSPEAKPLRIPLGPRHNTYAVVRVQGLAGSSSPFAVVEALHGADQSEMAKQGIAVVAAKHRGEYYVLNTTEGEGGGHAEELLDQRCR